MEIRPFRPADSAALTGLHPRARRLPEEVGAGGRAWLAVEGEGLIGYASVVPVPGLTGVVDFDCFVVPGRQRQGVGSALTRHVIQAVAGTEIEQLSHAVSSLESGAAQFLQDQGFYLDHEEWRLEHKDLATLPPLSLPEGGTIQTFGRREAIEHFRTLYEQSFGGTPWYQPYTEAEVAADLDKATDLLFILRGGEPAGFAWTRLVQGKKGVIEPFGVASPFQGRGLGRALLRAALHQLARRGAQRVQLGLWRRNQAALALYLREGFQHRGTRYYLARDL